MLIVISQMNDLEVVCEQCNGRGTCKYDGYFHEREVTCLCCGGKCYVLTEFGEKVLEMVKRHLQIEVKL